MKALNIYFLGLVALFPTVTWAQEVAALPPAEPIAIPADPENKPSPASAAIPEPDVEPEFPAETLAPSPVTPSAPATRPQPLAAAGEQTRAEKSADPILPPAPKRLFWECQLPGGNFSIAIPDIVSVSLHEFVLEEEAILFEATVATRSSIVARFFHRHPLFQPAAPSAESPLAEGRRALERVHNLMATGRHIRSLTESDPGLPVKRRADVALAPTVEFRLAKKADVVALYQSAYTAWKQAEEGFFQLGE